MSSLLTNLNVRLTVRIVVTFCDYFLDIYLRTQITFPSYSPFNKTNVMCHSTCNEFFFSGFLSQFFFINVNSNKIMVFLWFHLMNTYIWHVLDYPVSPGLSGILSICKLCSYTEASHQVQKCYHHRWDDGIHAWRKRLFHFFSLFRIFYADSSRYPVDSNKRREAVYLAFISHFVVLNYARLVDFFSLWKSKLRKKGMNIFFGFKGDFPLLFFSLVNF